MARKAKKAIHRMPPLSFVYWTLFTIMIAADFLLLVGPLILRDIIAFADETVVATVENISIFWILIPQLTFTITTFILWYNLYQARKPIFGNQKIKYGPPAWPKEYPMFMKNKPYIFVSAWERKIHKRRAVTILIVLIISFLPFPLGLFGRSCLHNDGSIRQYNMYNRQTKQFNTNEIVEVTIEPFRVRSYHWSVKMVCTTAGSKEYSFDYRGFRDKDTGEIRHWLAQMSEVKKCYDVGIIYYEGVEKLEHIVERQRLSPAEAEMLYELFGQPYLPYQ